MRKTVGIVGLGLIGGSLAKAFTAFTEHRVLGYDADRATVEQALNDRNIADVLGERNFGECESIIIALYPRQTVEFVKNNVAHFKKGTLIVDCAGVKKNICTELSPFLLENGLYFIGGHPMAGLERSGYEHSSKELFLNASMILCVDETTNIVALKAAELLFLSVGFGVITVTSADEHDRMIAYTSQLAHVVSNAFVKSETASMHKGFSAGSFRDLTRVARLNERMWAELFLENKEHLTAEIEALTQRLADYVDAMKRDDREVLEQLLRDGTEAKERADVRERTEKR